MAAGDSRAVAAEVAAAGAAEIMMRFDIDASLEILSRTPAALRALLSGLPSGWIEANEGRDTFSPFDVVGHLVDGEEKDWIARSRIVLAGDPEAEFEPFDRFRHRARNKGRTLESLLDEFERLRALNIETLKSWSIGDRQLAMTAMHPTLGKVTLSQLLATWVVHDLGHIAQVSRVMAKQYRDEAGPWIEYLPVLTDRESPQS